MKRRQYVSWGVVIHFITSLAVKAVKTKKTLTISVSMSVVLQHQLSLFVQNGWILEK